MINTTDCVLIGVTQKTAVHADENCYSTTFVKVKK